MHTYIFSKEEAMRKIADNSFPKRAAVISFYDSDEEDKEDNKVNKLTKYIDNTVMSMFPISVFLT